MTQHNQQPAIAIEQLLQNVDKAGYFRLLGIQVEIPRPGVGHVRTQIDDRLFHPQQLVHGGVIFTLADTAMSFALISVLPEGMRVSTIEAKINYFLPVLTGELLAEGTIVHQGRRTAVAEATVFNINGSEQKAIARLLGTFNIAPPKPAQEKE